MPWNSRLSGRLAATVVALMLLWTLPNLCLAQSAGAKDWNKVGDTLEGAIGLHYGNLGGNGLSFRLPVRWYFYVQAGGGIWHAKDDQRHNLGLEINYILRQDATIRLYLAGGLGYFYHRELVGKTAGVDTWNKTKNWNTGVGVGIEYLLGSRVALQGEFDFVHESGDGEVKVSPQIGLHFYW